MSYVVDLDAFHGPLDLLLYLVEKNELDIYDIPVAVITDQYIEHLQSTGDFDLERMGDFILMASYLLNLKSRMLLPRNPFDNENEEDELTDPRDELVQKLLDYKKFKQAAQDLLALQDGDHNRIYYREHGNLAEPEEQIVADIKVLLNAYSKLLNSLPDEQSDNYHLPREDINIADKMEELITYLRSKSQGIIFQVLFSRAHNRREALAFFLALLELIRLQKVIAVQDGIFSDIIIRLREGDE
ncbi:MAG: segregation/condensation protein A [Syntrophomonadaceae bacterium]|nr:segregation/condensation protein A [Syntrophomonadaceae bacterium]MDD3889575.1 segregation/condensation protein A [Syntrophomonadaceae bacterium]MDD4548645.1 segregation/condensation protein A [Syntrophomonadaceae bacterium]